MLVVDPARGEIVDANLGAARFYGYSREQMIGMPASQIDTKPWQEIDVERKRAVIDRWGYFDYRHRLASGEVRDVEVYISPIDVDGRMLDYSVICDITERKQAEESLRESADLLNQAQSIGSMGCFVLDIPSGAWQRSGALDELLGVNKEYDRTFAGWLALVHPMTAR